MNEPKLRFPEFSGEWEEKKLGDSFHERTEKNRDDLPLLSLGEEGLSYQSETTRKDNSSADKSKYLRVAIGDIAYNTMRMWQGRCVFVDKEGIVSPAYTVCEPKEGIDSMFHYYLFKTDGMIRMFHQHSQGLVSDTLNLKYDAFSKIKYCPPPTPAEQRKIASCLSAMDDLIAAQAEKVEALKEKKAGLMQQLFPQNGETTPRLRFPEFTGEWEEKTLGEVSPVIFDGTHQTPHYVNSGIPFYSIENIVSDKPCKYIAQDEHMFNTKKNKTEKGDILITRIGTIGFAKIVDWDGEFSTYVSLATIKKSSLINTRYLLGYLQSEVYQKEMRSKSLMNAVPCKINMEDLKNTRIAFPKEPKEQQKIASCLSALDDQIAAETEKLTALKDYKKGLMQQLFPQPAK